MTIDLRASAAVLDGSDIGNERDLAVPETMVSMVRAVGQEMAGRLGGAVVVKPLSRQIAGLVDEKDRAGWERAMHLTQERIQTRRHVRLTVVDGIMYAAQIESPHLDWRRDLDACRYRVVTTPVEVARRVRRLMAVLRLRYAALDFALDGAGRWWFLEVNPNGQFLWIEHETGLPIAAAVATALRLTPPVATATPTRMAPRGALLDDANTPPALNGGPMWTGGETSTPSCFPPEVNAVSHRPLIRPSCAGPRPLGAYPA